MPELVHGFLLEAHREPGGLARKAASARRAVETTAARPLSCASPNTNVRTGMKRSTSVSPRMRAALRGRREASQRSCGARSAGCAAASKASSGPAAGELEPGRSAKDLLARARARSRGAPRRRPAFRSTRARPRSRRRGARRAVLGERKPDRHRRSRADAALHLHRAAVLLDDAVDDGEAEARALLLRREEGVEDAREVLGRDAGARVRDGDLDLAAAANRSGTRASACRPRASRRTR